MRRRIVRHRGADRLIETNDFPFGVWAVKVEHTEWEVDDEHLGRVGFGYDAFQPVRDDTVIAIPDAETIRAIKLLDWPLAEYLRWQDDGGHDRNA